MDSREVTVHRVVNIVEKRSAMPRPLVEFDRGFNDDQWYSVPQHYLDERERYDDEGFPSNDRRYFDDNSNGHFRRNTPHDEGPYFHYGRDDLRHQLGPRNSDRNHHFRSRGRGSGAPRRSSPSLVIRRDRSPGRREAPHRESVRSGPNTSNRSFTYQQAQKRHRPNSVTSHTPSSSVEEPPHSSGSSKEKTPASVAETGEVVAASVEPEPTPEEDFKARRLEAIKAKALEIETHYRKDCETFRTVVKMLAAKEPSLDNLLQAPLDENLLEIKQRCLDALRHFVKELDEVLKQPDTSA